MDMREDGSETFSHRDYLVLFAEVVQEIKYKMKSEGREDEFVGAKVRSRPVCIVEGPTAPRRHS
jgi:hypothetical protein